MTDYDAEERAAELRHYLRNRFAAIRNAAFYLQRRVASTELWQSDERVKQFFELIASELVAADEKITRDLRAERLLATDGDAKRSEGDGD